MSDELTDERLVEQARAGDSRAFAALVHRHSAHAFRISVRLTGSTADAEDAVQDAFVQAHRSLDDFRGDARFSTWLYRIVTNAALMRLRSEKRHPAESLDALLPKFDADGFHARLDVNCSLPELPDAEAQRRELRLAVNDALDRLPEGCREAFVLRDLEGMSTREVGIVLGVDAAAVRQRVHRARLVLRGLLRRNLGGEP